MGTDVGEKGKRQPLVRLGLEDLSTVKLYQGLFVELLGTVCWMWCHLSILRSTAGITDGNVAPFVSGAAHSFILTLLIYTMGDFSGAHFNSFVTMAEFFASHVSAVKALGYILVQLAGATIATLMFVDIISMEAMRDEKVGHCRPGSLTPMQAMASEVVWDFIWIFVAFGTMGDAARRQRYGERLSVALMSATLGFAIWFSGSMKPGYGGAGFNPALCWGPALVLNKWNNHWVFWIGPLIAAILSAMIFRIQPHLVGEIAFRQQIRRLGSSFRESFRGSFRPTDAAEGVERANAIHRSRSADRKYAPPAAELEMAQSNAEGKPGGRWMLMTGESRTHIDGKAGNGENVGDVEAGGAPASASATHSHSNGRARVAPAPPAQPPPQQHRQTQSQPQSQPQPQPAADGYHDGDVDSVDDELDDDIEDILQR